MDQFKPTFDYIDLTSESEDTDEAVYNIDHDPVFYKVYDCQMCLKPVPKWVNGTNTLEWVCKQCEIAAIGNTNSKKSELPPYGFKK